MASSSGKSNARGRVDRLDALTSRPAGGGGLRLDERVATLRERLESRADVREAAGLRAGVREARDYVRGWSSEKAVSDTTAARYGRVVEQMREAGQQPEDARCKSTFEFRRAAVVHEARSEIKAGLRDLDKFKRAGDVDRAAAAYSRVRGGLETLRRYPPSTGNREQDLQRRSAFRGPAQSDPDRSNGKRGSLDGLPDDWRDRVQSEVRQEDRAPLAVLALSGCRPAEVKGVKVRQDVDSISLEIQGAKFDEDRGIASRSLTFEKSDLAKSQAGRDLTAWLGGRQVRTISHGGTVEAFRERVSRAAARAGLDQVSAYSYRHAEARHLKNSGTDRGEIANRLGHRSDRSQSVYG